MADIAQIPTTNTQLPQSQPSDAQSTPTTNGVKPPPRPRGPSRAQQLNALYSLPAPLRTFPLPTFVPHNPLSLFHIIYVWLRQTAKPELSHFDPPYQGWYSPETRSVHVTDARSIRGLWEQGFYGKGSLSRSEPSWMTREKTRRGTKEKATSEEMTRKRRDERQQVKWERARKEREAIDMKLSEEAQAESSLVSAKPHDEVSSTTGVIEISSPLPNGKTLHGNSPDSGVLKESSTVVMNGSAKSSLAKSPKYIVSPVGPLELLALPNSSFESGIDLEFTNGDITEPPISRGDALLGMPVHDSSHTTYRAPVGPLELLATPNSFSMTLPQRPVKGSNHVDYTTIDKATSSTSPTTGVANGHASHMQGLHLNRNITGQELTSDPETSDDIINGSSHSDETIHTNGTANGSALTNGHPTTPKIKRQKSVRFSPTVEKNTFIQSEPPSPDRSSLTTPSPLTTITTIPIPSPEPPTIKSQEHTQLTLEEAFFLSYALGALTILSPTTHLPIPAPTLFSLFRHSHFPPLPNPIISPDDPFIVNYVVYHHFRSLGWVPRSGIKFSCDLMLYNRGPVFDHAEFGVVVLPSYSDGYWSRDAETRAYVEGKEKRTWHWMNCINRVITQVKKTLILCYVDIPPPVSKEVEAGLGVDGVLGRYRVREVVLKRFSANRMRE